MTIKPGSTLSMSSWNRGKKLVPKAKPVPISYYDLTTTNDVASTYLNFLGTYIYSQKLGETCNVYDPNKFINITLKYNPQVKFITDIPDNSTTLNEKSLSSITSTLKFADIQRYASIIFQYTAPFNRSVIDVLEKASIKTVFDIGIHLTTDSSGIVLPIYSDILSEIQKKSKKATLTVYVMADSYEIVKQFQGKCDPSWKITSLSKTVPKNESEVIVQRLAEVQIFAASPAVVLDFSNSIDRFIYLMQRNPKGYDFFREVNGLSWSLF
jgi:hypothetical protein